MFVSKRRAVRHGGDGQVLRVRTPGCERELQFRLRNKDRALLSAVGEEDWPSRGGFPV